MLPLRRAFTVILAILVSTILTATSAFADGLHLMGGDPMYVWSEGCAITYSIDAGIAADYGEYMPEALAYIAPHLGFTFTQVPEGTGLVNYTWAAELPSGAQGIGSTDGGVRLAPKKNITDHGWEGQEAHNLFVNLIVHESLHVFGLDHDTDEGAGESESDEIMYPVLTPHATAFGNGDLTGMEYVRNANQCPAQAVPAPAPAPAPSVTPPIVIDPDQATPPTTTPPVAKKRSAKQRCLAKPGRKWNSRKHRCVKAISPRGLSLPPSGAQWAT